MNSILETRQSIKQRCITVIKQTTLKNRATGVGLHRGEKIYLTLRPVAINTVSVFRRVARAPAVEIKAQVGNVILWCDCRDFS